MATTISATGSVLCCAPISKAVARQAQHLRDRGVPPLAHIPRAQQPQSGRHGAFLIRGRSLAPNSPKARQCRSHSVAIQNRSVSMRCRQSSGGCCPRTLRYSIDPCRVSPYRPVGRLWGIVIAVVVKNQMLKEYAQRSRTNPTMAPGRFLGAMEVLDARYSAPEEAPKARHIIDGQTESGRRASCRRRR